MADEWNADDANSSLSNAKTKDTWDADDPPDSWDAPVSAKSEPKVNSSAANKQPAVVKKPNDSATRPKQKEVASSSKQQRVQPSDNGLEKARIELAKAREVANFISDEKGCQGDFELLQPSKKEDFDLLQQLILAKLANFKVSKEFNPFVESLFLKVANELDTKTLKAVSGSLAMITKEKELAEKAAPQKENAADKSASVPRGGTSKATSGVGVGVKKSTLSNVNVGSIYDYQYDDAEADDFDDDFQLPEPPKVQATVTAGGYYDEEGEI